jgi:putative membrane protein
MPSAVARRIGALLREAYEDGRLDALAFSGAEHQRTMLMDHIGECERILATPLPRAFSIEIRRSIVFFLVTLTFALLSKDLGWSTLLLLVLVAYAVLSLDLIGSSLQNPFAIDNLGALPLNEICRSIEEDLMGLLNEERHLAEEAEAIPDREADGPGEAERIGRSFQPSPPAS